MLKLLYLHLSLTSKAAGWSWSKGHFLSKSFPILAHAISGTCGYCEERTLIKYGFYKATGGKIWGKNCWVISQLVVVFWLLGKPWSTSLQVPKVLAGFAFTLNIYLYSDIWRKFSRSIFIGKYIYIYIYAWWLKSLGSLFVLQWVFRETRELADVLGKPWLICLIPTPLWG